MGIRGDEHQPWLLYNLNEDPYEMVNLAYNKFYREDLIRMHHLLLEWIEQTGDEFNVPKQAWPEEIK